MNINLLKKTIRNFHISQYSKRCLFESLISEDDSDNDVNANFDVLEKLAKEKYEAAKAAIDAYDENLKRKTAFDKELARLRSNGMGEDRARKQLRTNPDYAYSPALIASKRENLEQELEKTEIKYSAFSPEIRGFTRTKKGSSRSSAKIEKPDLQTKVIIDINNIQYLKWHSWPIKVIKGKIPYGTKNSDSEGGVGPGENWVAITFGGKIQGGSVSYDVVLKDDSKWEVKQLLTKSETVRPGTEGLKAFEDARERLENIMHELQEFCNSYDKSSLKDFLNKEQISKFEFIKSFIEDEFEMIVSKGEISKERFIDLRTCLITCSQLRSDLHASVKNKTKTVVGLNDKNINVDKTTFVDIAKQLEKATNRDDILTDINEIDIVFSSLKDSAFTDVKKFFNEWFNSVKVSNVFSQVDGLIIVNPNQFMVIPKEHFNNTLKFDKVTQGKPRFLLTIF